MGRNHEKTVKTKPQTGGGSKNGILHVRNWDTGKWEEATKSTSRPKGHTACKFVQIPYKEWVEYARRTKDPRWAVIAELYRLYFETWEKKKHFPFGLTETLRDLGVRRWAKARVLRELERLGWIKVKQEKGKASMVLVLKGFYLKQGD